MINYLQIFLLPKNNNIIFESNGSNLKIQEGCKEKPLLISTIPCDSDIFEYLNTVVDVPSIHNEIRYMDLTINDIRKVINYITRKIGEVEERRNNLAEAYNKAKSHSIEEYKDFEEYYISLTEEYNNLNRTRDFFDTYITLFSDIGDSYCDFEKILVNYG